METERQRKVRRYELIVSLARTLEQLLDEDTDDELQDDVTWTGLCYKALPHLAEHYEAYTLGQGT